MAKDELADRPLPKTLAAFVAVAILGGGNAVAIKIGLMEFDPFWAAAIRFLAASLLLLGLMAIFGLPLPTGRAFAGAMVYGALNFGLAFAFIYYALTEVTAGTTQVAIALTPFLVVLLSAAHGLEVLDGRAVIGALLALVGTAIIVLEGLQGASLVKLLALLVAVICFAEAAVTVKRFPRVSPIAENAVGQGIGGLILLAISMAAGEAWIVPTGIGTILSLLFLIVFGSMALFGLYIYVIESWTASAASYALVAMPVFTVIFARFLLDEAITSRFFLGSAAIAIGLHIGVFSRYRRRN